MVNYKMKFICFVFFFSWLKWTEICFWRAICIFTLSYSSSHSFSKCSIYKYILRSLLNCLTPFNTKKEPKIISMRKYSTSVKKLLVFAFKLPYKICIWSRCLVKPTLSFPRYVNYRSQSVALKIVAVWSLAS